MADLPASENFTQLDIKNLLVSLFIRAPDLGFLKPLCSKAQFFVFDPARKIRDTNKNLVEEVRDLPKRERDRLSSSLRLILYHLLKWDYQSHKRSRSWLGTIQRERANID